MSAPPAGTLLCRTEDLSDPGSRGFGFWTGEIMFRGFVVKKDGKVQGWRDRCPHVGTPLTFGDDRYLTKGGEMILCVTHGALFRIDDGFCVGGPCAGQRLTPWPITVADGEVRVA